jgi:hypothetical protein
MQQTNTVAQLREAGYLRIKIVMAQDYPPMLGNKPSDCAIDIEI